MKRSYVFALFFAITLMGISPAADNVKVPLVLQVSSDCDNSDVAQTAAGHPELVVGFVNVHYEEDGKLLVIVHLKNAMPDTEFTVHIKCEGTFAEKLHTNSKGVGNAVYTVQPEWGVGLVFGMDVYREIDDHYAGGEIYQSAQVNLEDQ